jgi:hypothetical protein
MLLWLLLALLASLPVLLGLVPGVDARAARTVLLRCTLAGLVAGTIVGVLPLIYAPRVALGGVFLMFALTGAAIGAGVGLVLLVLRRLLVR